MKERIPELETKGSGWIFQRVSTLQIHLAKYKPLKGSSYFELPEKLALKKAIVNVKNEDQQCFKWAVLSALFTVSKDAQRLSKYTAHESELNWDGLTFPVTLQQIPKFEKRNKVSINVYGWDKSDKPYLLQKSKIGEAEKHVDLLLLEEGANSHYCWIKNFSRFARQPSDHKHCAKHYCHYCMIS